jgi:hypothetical protein
MKKLGIILIALVALSSCDKTTNKYMCYEPVYTDSTTFRAPATFESAKSITKDGAIYFKDNYLFIVEPNKGIHFIDNDNPSNPINTGFLNVMGASGLSIKDNFLYVNAMVDLVTIDVSSFSNPVEVNRIQECFPSALPLMDRNYPTKTIDKSKGIVTDWNVVETTEDVNDFPQWNGCPGCEFVTFDSNVGGGISAESVSNGSSTGTGTSGSYALMTIMGDYLYVVDNWRLRPFSLSNPAVPAESESYVYLSWNVETIFPNGEHLYMGTTTGMMIYETSNPENPTKTGSISHARACDPVTVQGNYAYVTVRSAGWCGGDINQLDVVDISDKYNPYLVESFEMNDPRGVGIDGNTFFLCDGDAGLKVFDAENPDEVGDHLLKKFGNIFAVDIIPINGVAMVIGDDGLYQYDYSDPTDLQLLSEIKF